MSHTSPARTPSKSSNVERLLSLQKSTKHISDADILSFAAEASAMKRIAKASAISDENANPNARSVSKRLFDIGQCSKVAMGSYSPEASAQAAESTQNTLEERNGSDTDSDAEDEQEDTVALAEKHVEQILQLVDRSASKAMQRREVQRAAARELLATSKASHNTVSSTVAFHDSTGADQASSFDDHDDGYPVIEEEGNGVLTAAASTASTASNVGAPAAGTITVGGIKDLVIAHILNILNTGTYEEILSLHGIGQVRAMRIVTARNAGHTFVSLEDLEEVGMNEKTVARFLKSNAAAIVS